jgi:uncharacterized protein YeaO (DUF488 family)
MPIKIYTSYFGNLKKVTTNNIFPVGIARFAPRWSPVYSDKRVAPSGNMLNARKCGGTVEGFYAEYKTILNDLNANDLVATWEIASEGKDIALCCYEKVTDDCHRHYLARWLMENLKGNVRINEFGYPDNKGVIKAFGWKPEHDSYTPQPLNLFGESI